MAAFLSHLEVSWRFKVSVRLLYCFLAVVQLINKLSSSLNIFYSEVEFIDSRLIHVEYSILCCGFLLDMMNGDLAVSESGGLPAVPEK